MLVESFAIRKLLNLTDRVERDADGALSYGRHTENNMQFMWSWKEVRPEVSRRP